MAMVAVKSSTCKANLSQTFPFDTNNNKNKNDNRDASFSSYLSGNEEAFVRKLAEEQQKKNDMGEKKEDLEEEIGVFGAEKYFNGVMDVEITSPESGSCSTTKYHHDKEKKVSQDHMKVRVQPGTPSVRSESSWNSQSALLRTGSRNPYRSNAGKGQTQRQKKNFFASLGCKCSCSDKNSVDVDEHVGEISFKKNNQINHKPSASDAAAAVVDLVSEAVTEMNKSQKLETLGRENCFTFPTSKSGAVSLPAKAPFPEEQEAETLRKSLEVFGSPVFEKRNNKSLGLEKRLTMLPWDKFPANSGGGIYNNESDSDASSDLFEIESLTGKGNPFLARQASSGCATPTNCYAPSEASIEWSVVTASVADFSVMSDFEDPHQNNHRPSPMKMVLNSTNGKIPRHRHHPTALLGCKSQKSVKIVGDAHRTCHDNKKTNLEQQDMRGRPELFVPATRFQAETTTKKLTGFDSRVQAAGRSLPRSHSPRAPHLLFMQ